MKKKKKKKKMSVSVELVCLEKFPPHLNPLDALIRRSHFDSVFLSVNKPKTIIFTPVRPLGFGRKGILMHVHAINEEENADCKGKNIESGPEVRLFVSLQFLQHYCLQELGSTGIVRAVKPANLHRVVLGFRCRNNLRLDGVEHFRRLLESCCPGQWLLARQGEALLLPLNLLHRDEPAQEILVLDCSPVAQGRMINKTSLVLTDCIDFGDPPGVPRPCRLLRLCVSDFAEYTDNFSIGRSLLDNKKLMGSDSNGILQEMECHMDVLVVDTQHWFEVRSHQGEALDMDNCVFMSKQLLFKLGLINKVWVKLWRPIETCQASTGESNDSAVVCKERPVFIQVVDLTLTPELEIHSNLGFLSATLWFNLTGGEMIPVNSCTLKMKRWTEMPGEPSCDCSDSLWCSASPLQASDLHIQPVVSPLYNNLSCYENLLADHFKIPRLVSKDDVLAVPVKNRPDLLGKNSEGINRCGMMFFKVQNLSPSAQRAGEEAHLANRTHTSLYMGVSINSPIPLCSLVGTLSSGGLSKTLELINIILPHLQYSSLCSCTILLHGAVGSGKSNLVRAASRSLNLHLLQVDSVSLYADSPASTEMKMRNVFQRASTLKPCILLMRNLQLLVRQRGATEDDGRVQTALCQLLNSVPSSVVVVATMCGSHLSAGLVAAFVHQVALENPTDEQRHTMLVSLSREIQMGRDVNLERLSKLTAGFVLRDLSALLAEAGRVACRRLIHTNGGQTQEDLCHSGVMILNQDLLSALETLQYTQSKAVGTPKIPNVHWEDVGGLHHVKKEILDTIQLPLQHPDLLSLGLNRTGVLLYGPPGTGKTLLAKAVATECSMTFLSVKGPELINMYVGQSEDNIREVFHRARLAAPCVVFFDELDSLAPSRGSSGDSAGVMDRVVSQLLAELDALHSPVGVFVIGATNRPDLLDQSLLRPGRFDKLVYVGNNKDRVSQFQVLQAILQKFQLDSAVNLQDLLKKCPSEMTGADLYALCSDAMTGAIKRKITLIGHGLDSEDSPVLLSVGDFTTAIKNFKPSVSNQELLRYESIQQKLTQM